MGRRAVILLPGSVLPAEFAYPPLLRALGDDRELVAKELEVYAADQPPAGYTLDNEVSGVITAADQHGFEQFHLVGYSGGGAAALATTAKHPQRITSLGLLEPAWAGNWPDQSPEHLLLWKQYERLEGLPPAEFMASFMRLGVRPEVVLPPPPPGDPPPWMRTRPAGIAAFLNTFRTYDLSREALKAFKRPVYFGLGALSNPDEYGEIAQRLSRTFQDFTLEVFEDRHHFDPPHRIEPQRLADSLTAVWNRAEAEPKDR